MDRNRAIGYLCAIGAFLLIVMAGRSCTQSEMKDSKKNNASETKASFQLTPSDFSQDNSSDYTVNTEVPTEEETVVTSYDVFGNPFIVTEPTVPPETDPFGNIIETTAPVTTEPEMITVTDAFGNVLGTEPVTVPVTTVTVDPALTTTLSPIDQYNENLKKSNPYGGYYGGSDTQTTVSPTLPSDFVLILG